MGRKSLSRKRKKITPRVEKWLASLLIQLQNQNLENLTIDEIARIAGKSKSTIYEYFETKEDILLAASQTRIRSLFTILNEKQNIHGNATEIYMHLVETFTEGISDITLTFLHQIKEFYPKSWQEINTLTDSFIDVLKGLYKQGIEEGRYRPISIELLANLDKYFVTEVVTNASLFSDPKYSLVELVNDYLTLRITGISIDQD